MRHETKEREIRSRRKQFNMCPTHGVRLQTTYYEDLDLLVTKCRDEDCIDGHGMTEEFQSKKEKKKKFWESKNAKKIVDDAINEMMAEDNKTQAQS